MRTVYLLAVGTILLVIGCASKSEIKAPPGGGDTLTAVIRPDQQMRNAQIFFYDKATRKTEILADYIEKYEKQDSTLAWGLTVYFYDSTGKEISNLVADSGLVRERTNMMVANGNVKVLAEDSSLLFTEQLLWNARESKIETDKFVTIIQKGDTLTGYGLEADEGLSKITIKKQVSGRFKDTKELEP